MDQFPYTIEDVLRLLNISYPQRKNIRIACPFCSGRKINKDLGIAMDTEKFHCYSCGISGRGGTQFYAYYNNLTTKEAYSEIMDELGLKSNSETTSAVANRVRNREIYEKEVNVEAEIASQDILNNTYRNLLDELHLAERDKEDLLARGFTDFEISLLGYKSYPTGNPQGIVQEYFDISKKLELKGCTLKGVPGFYRTKNKGVWTLCWRKSGILVPYVSYDNKIVGLQLRKHDNELEYNPETGEREHKYSWISSLDKNDGCRVKTFIHYACDFEWNTNNLSFSPIIEDGIIGFTEGAMKADLYHCITGRPILAVPGVGILEDVGKELLRLKKEKGIHTVAVLYDMDYLTNEHVKKFTDKLESIVKSCGLTYKRPVWNTKVDGIDLLKGIDDYYAYHKRGIKPIIKKEN